MHEIQKQILKKLSESKKARYSELKRKDLEGNIFSYHLKTLMKQGYVIHKDTLYSLTSKAKQLVDRLSYDTLTERMQPKIITTLILEKDGKYLLYKRKKEPFIDHVCFPYGKIHLEERLGDAAIRELAEKTGLHAKLKYRGHIYLTVHDETELVSSMVCNIFTGSHITGNLKTHTKVGECFWGELKDIPKSKILPGVLHIVKLLKENKNQIFFAEYFLNTTSEN
jgi:ADP-ribose pyrophosphatase YjhB (NUDIX family)